MKKSNWFWIILFILLGISTLIPSPASKACLLGYYAHCSFVPISTIILFGIAGLIYYRGKKKEKSDK